MEVDKNIAQSVSRLEKDLVQMKTSQPVGSGSVRAYETLTNNIWDSNYTFTAANYNGLAYTGGIYVKFISRTQSAPFATIRVIAEINGQKYNPLSAQNFAVTGPTAGIDNAYVTIYEDIFNSGSLSDYALDNTVKWQINTSARSIGTVIRLKVIVTATDMGRIIITPFNTF